MDLLQIKIQDKTICIPKSEKTISFVLIGYNDEFDLFIHSSDYIRSKKWCEVKINENQDISVLSSEHCIASSPIDVEIKNDEELVKEYQALKTLLTKRKII